MLLIFGIGGNLGGGNKTATTADPAATSGPSSSQAAPTTTAPATTTSAAPTTTVAPTTVAPTTVAPPPPPPPPPAQAAEYGDGTYRIGSDMPAGTYRSSAKSNLCYWARLSGFGGGLENIIGNGNRSPEIVAIAASDAGFETRGCGDWTPVETTYPAAPAASFTDGTFVVGKDIAPSTYRADGGAATSATGRACRTFRRPARRGVIANGNSPTVVTIKASDKGFTASGCGTWTKNVRQ